MIYSLLLYVKNCLPSSDQINAICSVTQSCPTLCNPVDCSMPGFPVLHHLPELLPGFPVLRYFTVSSNSCPLSWWCHPTISSSFVPFSSCLQSFSASGSFQISQFFSSGGQSIGVSASVSFLPMNIQDWSPLGWTGWITLQFKGLLLSLEWLKFNDWL